MKHELLEKERHTHIRKRRILTAAACLLSLACVIIFAVLYAQSREATEIDYGFGVYRSVTYNDDWIWGLGIGWLLHACFLIVFACDVLFTRLKTVEIDGCYITLYRGMAHTYLYVDGEQKDGGVFVGYHLEAPLPGGECVHVALGKWSAYMTISSGCAPIEL